MKRLVAGSVTVLVLIAFLIVAARPVRPAAQTPDQCLEQMVQAMKDGDVAAYLRCFSGELRERLDRNVQEQTTERFAEYLKEMAAPVKGRAVYKAEVAGDDHVRIVVDCVYEHRPWEYQGYWLRRESDNWTVYAIEPAEMHEPKVPFGTPVLTTAETESPTENAGTRAR